MNLIDENERNRLKNWAISKADKEIFQNVKNERSNSFWISREQEDYYIMEYHFDSVPQFEELCGRTLQTKVEEEIQRVISVAVFKNMPKDKMEETDHTVVDKLPEYRYVF